MSTPIYKPTTTYSGTWKGAEKAIRKPYEEKKRIPFYIDIIGPKVDDAIKDVVPEDSLDEVKSLWKADGPVKIKDSSPAKMQGYHGILLEKGLKVRYKREFGKDSKELYDRTANIFKQIEEYMQEFKEDVKFEK